MYVKTLLEKELIDNSVDFIYSSFVSDVLFGDDGQPAGLVISNRTGRQAILCKSIIDCTPGAYVARLAGGVFTDTQSGGEYSFSLITIGNKTEAKPEVKVRDLSLPVEMNGKRYNTRESEITFPYRLRSQGACTRDPTDVSDIPLTAFMPEGMNNFFVLSSGIDASQKTAGLITRPDNMINLGDILGRTSLLKTNLNKKII